MNYFRPLERERHCKDGINILSNLCFFYTVKLFKKGFSKNFQEEDLYQVPRNYKSSKLVENLLQKWEILQKSRKNPSVYRLIWRCYGWFYFLLGLIKLCLGTVVMLVRAYAIGKIVAYYVPNQTTITKHDLHLHAILLIGNDLFNCFYKHNYDLVVSGLGIEIRTALSSFIYRKCLKSKIETIGKTVTLITKDVNIFQTFLEFGNDLWIGILNTIAISIILYVKIGYMSLIAITSLCLVLLLLLCGPLYIVHLKKEMLKQTENRYQILQEVFSVVKIIKMYSWEKFFEDKASIARKKEVQTTQKILFTRISMICAGWIFLKIAFIATLLSYIVLDIPLSPETIYYIVSCFGTLAPLVTLNYPRSLQYLAEFLVCIKRIDKFINKSTEIEKQEKVGLEPQIHCKDLNLNIKNKKAVLENINVDLTPGLTIISGPVSSGKTCFLKLILGEFQSKPNISVSGLISYASQEPWLFPSTIRQNIVFVEKYDPKRYKNVLKVCALMEDLEQLQKGDQTIVEDRGSNLSGGQKVRINLARAIYRRSDIYLLDDSLSGLDSKVKDFILKNCIQIFLQNAITILTTQQVSGDNNKLCFSTRNIISDCSDSDSDDNQYCQNPLPCKYKNKEISPLLNKDQNIYTEKTATNSVNKKNYFKFIQLGGGFFKFFCVFCTFALESFSSNFEYKLISLWVNLESKMLNYTLTNSTNSTEFEEMVGEKNNLFYFYCFVLLGTPVFIVLKGCAFLSFIIQVSNLLHGQALKAVLGASMEFFDKNFIGNILNRFTKDFFVVDEMVSLALYYLLIYGVYIISYVILLAQVNILFLLLTSIVIVLLIAARQYYLKTARNLRRLDSSTRSALVGHTNATLEGLSTVRAFNAENILTKEFEGHLDLYTSASYTFECGTKAFSFFINLIFVIFLTTIVCKFVLSKENDSPGNIGLSLSLATQMIPDIIMVIEFWTKLENYMTSVERIVEYTEIKQERQTGLQLQNWPKEGEIKYQNVCLYYTNNEKPTLNNINFVVKPGEKLGIVGRTGAGKSTIISAIFRLYGFDGHITIDNVDIKTIALSFLRSRISIIPQDAIIFNGTIRENVDPNGLLNDEEIWNIFDSINLKNIVTSLDMRIDGNDEHFSVGQKHLLSLARAIVNKNKLVILDEVTASLDPQIEHLVQNVINKYFASHTTIIIAHKLKTIMECHNIIVVDKGSIVEYGSPSELVRNRNSSFFKIFQKQKQMF